MSFELRSSGVLVLALLALACDREAEARAEAKMLLEKLRTLSGDGSLSDRQASLDGLKALPLKDPSHARARDVCHAAHLQLLQAEAAQTAARKALEAAARERQPGGGGTLSPERGAAIAVELQRSNDALSAAKRGFPECETATVALTREGR